MTTSFVNVASHLAAMAAADPERVAVRVPHRGVERTFAELHAESDAVAANLAVIGVGRGTRVAVMVPPSVEFFSLTFALLKAAAVPVLIDPGMGVRNLKTCLAEAEPEAFIGVAKAHLARRLLGWAKQSVRVTVNVGRGRFFCTRSYEELASSSLSPASGERAGVRGKPSPAGKQDPLTLTLSPEAGERGPDVSPSDLAAILFTSGSTGIAKGAEYTHGIFAAQVEALKDIYGIRPGEVDLCTFPLFALFGPALGMSCVVPEMNPSRPATIDPAKAVAAVEKYGVTNLFGSPAVIRRLAEYGKPLPTLKRAISAGAPASIPVVESFAKLLSPGVELFTPYGATEALPVANIGSGEILNETRPLTESGRGVCVGRPVAGIDVFVIPITDEPIATWNPASCLPVGEVGEFVVRGAVVTKRYFRREQATALAKILDPATGDVLHRMGDVGYRDDRGWLWFCGRKSHRVETGHGTLFTDMVEPIFNTVPGVARTALVGVNRRGTQYPVLCVEPNLPADRYDQVLFALNNLPMVLESLAKRAQGFEFARSLVYLLHPQPFPVDVRHNSKIFREKLAVWADKQLGPNWTGPTA